MEMLLIRHGKTDYSPVTERCFIGHGRSLAPLSDEGVLQAEQAARSPFLKKCELIVASPYTRALQTAAIIAGKTGLPLTVEVDLREWEPDLTYQFGTDEESRSLHDDFILCRGKIPEGETRRWETIESLIQRIDPVFRKLYEAEYKRIAVVAHGGVIRRLTGRGYVPYCTPEMVEYNGSFNYLGWIE